MNTASENLSEYYRRIHGTHVAGIISAKVNNRSNGQWIGTSGVALNTMLYAFSTGHGDNLYGIERTDLFGRYMTLLTLIEGANAKVINYSAGYNNTGENEKPVAQFERDARNSINTHLSAISGMLKELLHKGYDFVIVTSGGNDPHDAAVNNHFCAITDEEVSSHIIVVGGASPLGLFKTEWCYGTRIDVVAPGTNICSTACRNEHNLSDIFGNHPVLLNREGHSIPYAIGQGTSMASPHVAGIAALVWAAKPDLPGNRVKDIIMQTADIELANPDAAGHHHNMVNAAHAVAEALGKPYKIQGKCGDNAFWTIDPETWNMTISGSGAMYNYSASFKTPWYHYKNKVVSLEISGRSISTETRGDAIYGESCKQKSSPKKKKFNTNFYCSEKGVTKRAGEDCLASRNKIIGDIYV